MDSRSFSLHKALLIVALLGHSAESLANGIGKTEAFDRCQKALTSEERAQAGAAFLASRGYHERPELNADPNRTESATTFSAQERVASWLSHLDRTIESNSTAELEKLKRHFHDLYVVKEKDIPQTYFEQQIELARQLGHGTIKLDETEKSRLAKILLQDQKASLDAWLDYLLQADTTDIYPTWIKYWTLVEVGKLGKFNVAQGSFSGRPLGTVAPFPELNQEAYSLLVDVVLRHVNKESLPEAADPSLLQLLKKKNFGNLYGRALQLSLPDEKLLEITTGQWVKFEKGSDHMMLANTLKGQATGWCTAGESTAQAQLSKGDFYIYYSKDISGKNTVPRIAIRMQGNSIAEIRGRGDHQNLDPQIAGTEILSTKLLEFGAEGERYLVRVRDMERLTEIESKTRIGKSLSKEEIRFLYELDGPIEGFGYAKDPRITELKSSRDPKADMAFAFDCRPDQISLTQEDALKGGILVHLGDLTVDIKNSTKNADVKMPLNVLGDLIVYGPASAKGLILPKYVKGKFEFESLKSPRGLVLPEYIGGDIGMPELRSGEGLKFQEKVNGSLHLQSMLFSRGMILPRYLAGTLYLQGLSGRNFGSGFLSYVGLIALASGEADFVFPGYIGGGLLIDNLSITKKIKLPSYVGGEIRSSTHPNRFPEHLRANVWRGRYFLLFVEGS